MPKLTPHDALIHLMVVMSASDRDMTESELARIGAVTRSWPVFQDFDDNQLVAVAQQCQRILQQPDGLTKVLDGVRENVPERLFDTAYALAFEVAAVDLEMRLEEVRVLQLLRRHLPVDTLTVAAIERAAKARHRTLT